MSLSTHCIGHITTGSFMGRGNWYIQLVKVETASSYQLCHLRLGRDSNFDVGDERRKCYHSVTVAPYKDPSFPIITAGRRGEVLSGLVVSKFGI